MSFLPVLMPTNAPGAPSVPREHQRAYRLPSTEPIYITSTFWSKQRLGQVIESGGGHYLTFWYVGQISEDAVRSVLVSRSRSDNTAFQVPEENTGMADEKTCKASL